MGVNDAKFDKRTPVLEGIITDMSMILLGAARPRWEARRGGNLETNTANRNRRDWLGMCP